ncbi:Ankyrin repeat and LEM domain-containing protein 2 [Aphelenchoides bicaudatus]|nr:Ankyrin repeat and LEM domain-containing protein 2 [Aphelenchoides bicaudatus]
MEEDDEKPVYAAFIPTSPDRHVFREFKDMSNFFNSPEIKKINKTARFKKCMNKSEVDSFYDETAKSLLDFSINDSLITPSSAPVEAKSLFSEPEPPKLNRFRVNVERKNNSAFDDAVGENPRYILNTSLDGPTILQGAQRHNILHVACSSGNLYVVQRTFELLQSKDFLEKAYGPIQDVYGLADHLVVTFLNNPDKNANNTPLHFACKGGFLEIVRTLISYPTCRRDPVNRFEKTPLDILCESFKGPPGEKKPISDEIQRLLFSVSTPGRLAAKNRRALQANGLRLSAQMLVDEIVVENEEESFVDALDHFVGDEAKQPSRKRAHSGRGIKTDANCFIDNSDDEFFDAYLPHGERMDDLSDKFGSCSLK